MRRKIGITKRGNEVFSGDMAHNLHLYATGKSGVGKTLRVIKLITRLAKEGEVTIVINWRNNVNRNILDPAVSEEYAKYVTVIDVARDGIALPLFTPLKIKGGELENQMKVIRRITSILKNAVGLSRTQEDITLRAVDYVYRNNLYEKEGLCGVINWLNAQEKAVADNAAAKLRCLCDMGLIYDGIIEDKGKKIIEINLNGLEYDDQTTFVRFFMDYFLRLASNGCFLEKGINIFLDEVQNFDFSDGSTLFTIINESRRLNLRMLLATPSVTSSAKKGIEVLTQCGTQLYFEPQNSERKKVAQLIDPTNIEDSMFALTRLGKGECIACGNFLINGQEVSRPVVLQAEDLEIKS